MNKQEIIIIIISLLTLTGILIISINKVKYIESYIIECKEKGYDGVKYISKYSTDVMCSNFTQEERLDKEIDRLIKEKSK